MKKGDDEEWATQQRACEFRLLLEKIAKLASLGGIAKVKGG